MGDMVEVIFCCSSNDNQSTCTAWDYRTGTNLMSYKGGGSTQSHSLCILRANYVLAANCAKPLLHVWPINAQEQIQAVRFVVPGRVNALTLSEDGYYLVAGIQEAIYVWHLTTGRMLNTIVKHYQPINCLRFSGNSHFVSAGQDGSVLVWNLTQVVGRGDDNQTPLYSFTDHGLPVTDVHIGIGGMRAYMITVSLDRTCKIYDLNSGIMLLNLVFSEALHCVTSNALETCIYVGTGESNIYEFHTDALPRTKEYHAEKEHINCFKGHKAGTAVVGLALSLDGQTLISGGQDEQICIWHIPSRQLMRTIQHKGAITNLVLRLTNSAIFNPEHKQPHIFGGNLQRMIDPPEADEDQTIEVKVTDPTTDDHKTIRTIYKEIVTPRSTTMTKSTTNAESTEELQRLRAEVQHLKLVNKKLFEVSTKQLMRSKKK